MIVDFDKILYIQNSVEGIMKKFIEKIAALEQSISAEKGDFVLFALFLREDAQDKWDLVVSAPWIEVNNKVALSYLANELKSHLLVQEMLTLSRIVMVDNDDPSLEAIHKAISVEHGMFEIKDSNFFGLQIKHAYIITSKRHAVTSTSGAV